MVKAIRPRDGSRRQAPRQSVRESGFGFTRLSRHQAIEQAAGLLRRSPTNTTAMRLIHLFHLDVEELASAGVPYELLRAIERQALMRL
jgi:hypothetical protein